VCLYLTGLQLEAAASRIGRKKEKAHLERGVEYDFVIEDQVDFVKDSISSAEVFACVFLMESFGSFDGI